MTPGRLNWMRSIAVLAAMMAGTAAHAQFESGTILSSVRDPQGGAIAGASVGLKNVETGGTAQTSTDANGNYQFITVQIGRYEVTVSATGFQAVKAADVEVAFGSVRSARAAWQIQLALKLYW